MTRGIYIVANDRVADNAIALLSSIRRQEPDLPVVMIPFNADYQQVAKILTAQFQVQIFPDLDFLDDFTRTIGEIFPRDFLKLPNKMRKLAAWFGPLEEFLYVDTDIVVFQPLSDALDYLKQADFINCDFHYKGQKLADVFSQTVVDQEVFSSKALQDVFNSGFWGSRRGSLSLETMTSLMKDCATHREYFDFSSGTTDQPIMNYLVLKGIQQRLNIVRVNPNEPGSWGGSSHFTERDHVLYDGDRTLRYLHWAGTPMGPGSRYRELWEYYRFCYVTEPLINPPAHPRQSIKQRIKSWTSTLLKQ